MPLKAEGEFALFKRHLEEALDKLSVPTKWGSMASDLDLYALLADGAAQMRDEPGLRQYAPVLAEMAERFGHKLYLGIALRAQGVAYTMAGEYPQAEVDLSRALKLFRGLKARWQEGRTLQELGELGMAQDDTAKARDHFTRALSAFEKVHAVPDGARTRARLESLGGPI